MNTLTRLVKQVYYPPRRKTGWSLETFLGQGEIRYFSYGRYALQEALKTIGIRERDGVLVPAFICRDLLAAINSLGATPLYYPVGKDLQMAGSPDDLPNARAIVAVNYFGFSQNLAPFKVYCDRTGAVLIEDNAHGLFSRDEAGMALGTRGAIGILSLRKTVHLPNGAALLFNATDKGWLVPPQISSSSVAPSRTFKVKRLLRCLAPFVGVGILRQLTVLERRLRKLRNGYEITPSPHDVESKMPESAAPCQELLEILAGVDVDHEINRRRELYLELEKFIRAAGGEPVFKVLPKYTSPYGFPFYSSESQAKRIKKALGKVHLDCYKWPELPSEIEPYAPAHYKLIWLVNFVW